MQSFRNCLAIFFLIGSIGAANAQGGAELGSKALKILYSAMTHEDSEVRVMAAKQWGPLGNPAAKRVLWRALQDKNDYVRIAAAESLHQLGDESGVKVLDEIIADAPKAGKGAAGALAQMRAIARNKVRAAAVLALGRIGIKGSKKSLRKALKDSDGTVRDAAAVSLARLGDGRVLGGFLAALGSGDPEIRVRAVEALGQVASPDVLDSLTPLAEDPEPEVRAAVMQTLGTIGDSRAYPTLKRGITDKQRLVRVKAMEAMGRVGDRRGAPLLQAARRGSKNAFVQLIASAGLLRLGKKVDLNTARRALSRTQADIDARLLAVEVIEAAGGDEAVGYLKLVLDDGESRVRVRAAAALVRLLRPADSRN